MHEHEKWLNIAKDDLKGAHFFFSQKPPQGALTFWCQQSAEKVLKAYLVLKNQPFKKTCDLKKLVKLCSRVNKEFETLYGAAEYLNPFTVRYVYPSEYGFATREIMQAALNEADYVMTFVLKKIHEHPCQIAYSLL